MTELERWLQKYGKAENIAKKEDINNKGYLYNLLYPTKTPTKPLPKNIFMLSRPPKRSERLKNKIKTFILTLPILKPIRNIQAEIQRMEKKKREEDRPKRMFNNTPMLFHPGKRTLEVTKPISSANNYICEFKRMVTYYGGKITKVEHQIVGYSDNAHDTMLYMALGYEMPDWNDPNRHEYSCYSSIEWDDANRPRYKI